MHRPAHAGSVKDVKWHEVHVGMVLEVQDNENIPADLLCLHCSHGDNICFIKTVNLDGELLPSPSRCKRDASCDASPSRCGTWISSKKLTRWHPVQLQGVTDR